MTDPVRTRRRLVLRRAVAALAAAAALALLPALPAAAHDELDTASPAAGSTVRTDLHEVRLTFAEPLVDLGGHRNGITVLDAAGRHFETACARLDGDDLVAPVALGAAGTYRVQWRGVSDDGHIVGNTYSFTYAPPSGTAAASGSADGPACGATASATEASGGGIPVAVLAVLGVVVLAALVGALVTVVRLRARGRTES